jgi:hypothetical protein
MGVVKTATGGYAVGCALMGVALACLLVLASLRPPAVATRAARA